MNCFAYLCTHVSICRLDHNITHSSYQPHGLRNTALNTDCSLAPYSESTYMSEVHLCPKPYKLLQKEVAIPDGFQQFRHDYLRVGIS